MDNEKEKLKELAKKYRWAILIFILGVGFLMMPTSVSENEEPMVPSITESSGIGETVSLIEGVGASKVLVTENGAVVVCEGAESSSVCYDITRAITASTGLQSDEIAIIKMK